MHVAAQGVGENGHRFAEEWQSNPAVHTDNMQKSRDNTAGPAA